jgi:hypothetical protein
VLESGSEVVADGNQQQQPSGCSRFAMDRTTMLEPEDVIFQMLQSLLLVTFILTEDDDKDLFESLLNGVILRG